ncbi:transcriptional regulator [Klebsiella indica]|uniref:Transcriptional regulator n=1 Tax=Klebsiella indica TaxID=2582917 RepID=A0A5R9LLQ3_9ENTR|nr:transcriptional regulator [Klebsiella indica]
MSPHCHFDNKKSHNDYYDHCLFDINSFNENIKTLKIK